MCTSKKRVLGFIRGSTQIKRDQVNSLCAVFSHTLQRSEISFLHIYTYIHDQG